MSLEDQIARVIQHRGLEWLLEWNDIGQEELVAMLLEYGIINIPYIDNKGNNLDDQ
jgi:hypothetical protein